MFKLSIIRLFLTFVVLAGCAFAQAGFDETGDGAMAGSPGRYQSPMPSGKFVRTCTLSGFVRDSNGRPAKDARIEVQNRDNGQIVSSGYSNPGGSFQISNLPTGNYELVVTLGLAESRQPVSLEGSDQEMMVNLPTYNSGANTGGKDSVSVAQLRVPERARNAFHKAQEAARKQNVADANKYVDEALQAYPRYADAMTMRGILKLDANHYNEASQDLEQAIQFDPNYPLAYIALGATYNLMSHWDDALRVLNRGTTLNPDSWQAYFEMGKSFLGKADYPAALQQFNKTQQIQPQYALVHLVKAHALLGMKDYANATTELEAYLKGEPNGSQSAHARETLDKLRSVASYNPGLQPVSGQH
ncbi:MAG TPA: tetratricopeptide repeat protein [Terriglobales bacterium]|jgi:Tfp pilus assembly protein PilF|nr:tetratricopeptide repeat protein [Terriglobales bacterium]